MPSTSRSQKYIKFIVYMAVIILLNAAGLTLFKRFDLTANNIYSISDASKEVVSTLSEPLTINVFFTENLPAPYNSTEQYLRDLLEEYSLYANDYFNYRFYNVSPDEGDVDEKAAQNRKLAETYGINPVQIQNIESDEVKFQKAYMGLVLIHGDMIERLPTLTTTEGLEYKLTTTIQKLNNKISALLGLRDNIQIKLFLSTSFLKVAPSMRLNAVSQLPEQVKQIVEKLNSKNYGKLDFKYLDPTDDEILWDDVRKHNINIKWTKQINGEMKPGEGAIGIVMEHAGKSLSIPLLQVIKIPIFGTQYSMPDIDEIEELINQSIEALVDINEDIGLLSIHGTLGGAPMNPMGMQDSDSISNFQGVLSDSYSIKNIDLTDENFFESVNCLLIARPTEQFSDYDLFLIDQFLMRGKNLALFLDTFNEVQPQRQQNFGYPQQPVYIPINSGIDKLLAHYGITIKQSYVMDENCFKQQVPPQYGGGERPIYFAPLIKSNYINNDFSFLNNIKGLVVMKISPLEIKQDRLKEIGISAHKLVSSSDKSWEMSGRINLNPMFLKPPTTEEEKQSFPIAYVLEGEFPSCFEGKPIPEKTVQKDSDTEKEGPKVKTDSAADLIKGERNITTKGKPAKIFIMASSEILTDKMFDENGSSSNSMFVMNVIDYLNGRGDIADMRSKTQQFNPLDETTAGFKAFIKSFNIVGLPVLVVLFGIGIYFRRQSRKKQIKMMFQK